MQFLVLGYDGEDLEATNRRMAARPAHLALGDKLKAEGKHLYAAAIMNDDEKMVGSAIICEFASKQELEDWLSEEPYVKDGVWKRIEVSRCKVGPSFLRGEPISLASRD